MKTFTDEHVRQAVWAGIAALEGVFFTQLEDESADAHLDRMLKCGLKVVLKMPLSIEARDALRKVKSWPEDLAFFASTWIALEDAAVIPNLVGHKVRPLASDAMRKLTMLREWRRNVDRDSGRLKEETAICAAVSGARAPFELTHDQIRRAVLHGLKSMEDTTIEGMDTKVLKGQAALVKVGCKLFEAIAAGLLLEFRGDTDSQARAFQALDLDHECWPGDLDFFQSVWRSFCVLDRKGTGEQDVLAVEVWGSFPALRDWSCEVNHETGHLLLHEGNAGECIRRAVYCAITEHDGTPLHPRMLQVANGAKIVQRVAERFLAKFRDYLAGADEGLRVSSVLADLAEGRLWPKDLRFLRDSWDVFLRVEDEGADARNDLHGQAFPLTLALLNLRLWARYYAIEIGRRAIPADLTEYVFDEGMCKDIVIGGTNPPLTTWQAMQHFSCGASVRGMAQAHGVPEEKITQAIQCEAREYCDRVHHSEADPRRIEEYRPKAPVGSYWRAIQQIPVDLPGALAHSGHRDTTGCGRIAEAILMVLKGRCPEDGSFLEKKSRWTRQAAVLAADVVHLLFQGYEIGLMSWRYDGWSTTEAFVSYVQDQAPGLMLKYAGSGDRRATDAEVARFFGKRFLETDALRIKAEKERDVAQKGNLDALEITERQVAAAFEDNRDLISRGEGAVAVLRQVIVDLVDLHAASHMQSIAPFDGVGVASSDTKAK